MSNFLPHDWWELSVFVVFAGAVVVCPAQLVDASLDHKLKDSSVNKL
jgi:hypothetical protein